MAISDVKNWNDVINRILKHSKSSDDYSVLIANMKRQGYDITFSMPNKAGDKIFFHEIIEHLNKMTKSNFGLKFPSATSKLILILKKDGYSVEQLKAVIDRKCQDWTSTPIEVNLTPKTLFKKSNFETYLGQTNTNAEPNKTGTKQGEFFQSVAKAKESLPAGSGRGK